MNMGLHLMRAAKSFAQKTAIIDQEKRLTFADFNNRVNQLAHGMLALGLKKGDRAAMLSLNCHQLLETFYSSADRTFESVVLVQYPRKGIHTVGLVTAPTEGELRQRTAPEMVNVFVPTTPNPTSGVLVLVPREELIFLGMGVEEALRFVVSGGIVSPPPRQLSEGAGGTLSD